MSEPARMTLAELVALVEPDPDLRESVELLGGPDRQAAPWFTIWDVAIRKVISGASVLIEAGPAMEPEQAIAVAAERYRAAWGAR